MPRVAASEKGGAQTASLRTYGVLDQRNSMEVKPNGLGRSTEERESRVGVAEVEGWIRSSAGHEESGVKKGGPPSKAKNSSLPIEGVP